MKNDRLGTVYCLIAVACIVGVSGVSCEKRGPKPEAVQSKATESEHQQHLDEVQPGEKAAREERLKEIQATQLVLEGKDAVAKTKAILKLQAMSQEALPIELVTGLIAALSDNTSVQIPENVVGADVTLNTQFGHGSVLRMQEGGMFPSDSGVVIAGKNAVLRVSTPGGEAKTVLVKMAGKDLGTDATVWKEWWATQRK